MSHQEHVYAVLSTGRCVRFQRMNVAAFRAAAAAAAAKATTPLELYYVQTPEQNLLRSFVGITRQPVPWKLIEGTNEADAKAMSSAASEAGLWLPLTYLELIKKDADTSMDNVVTIDEYGELLDLVRYIYSPRDAAKEAGVSLGERRLVEIMS